MAASGAATAARRKCWPASASPARASSKARTIAACPPHTDPDYAWIFAGIDGEIIGDYGLSGGGAAGFELDRADPVLGTPANAAILARSENPPASFVTVPEELLSHLHTVSGEPPDALMRGEIVYFDTESGGAVFAVGSITFCGSLWRAFSRRERRGEERAREERA